MSASTWTLTDSLLRWLALAAQLFLCQVAHAEDAIAAAAAHHQRALELYRSGHYPEALEELDAAERLHPAPLLDYNRGLVYRKMGDAAAALVHLDRYQAAGAALSERERAELQRVTGELQTKVGRLTLDGAPDGAEVKLDEKSVAVTPLAHPLLLNPGQHTVRVTLGAAEPFVEHFNVSAGELRSIRPQFASAAPPPVPMPMQVERQEAAAFAPPPPKSSDLPVILSWSAAGAMALGAAVSGALAYGEARRLDDLQSEAEQDGAEIAESSRRARNLALTCDILAGAALGVAGFSLYWTLTRSRDKVETTGLQIGPTHVRLRGQF